MLIISSLCHYLKNLLERQELNYTMDKWINLKKKSISKHLLQKKNWCFIFFSLKKNMVSQSSTTQTPHGCHVSTHSFHFIFSLFNKDPNYHSLLHLHWFFRILFFHPNTPSLIFISLRTLTWNSTLNLIIIVHDLIPLI